MKRNELSVEKVGNPPIGTLPVAYALELHRMIEQAAYFRAESDGFRLSPLDYWLAAENEMQKFP